MPHTVCVEISLGELLDRITIIDLKLDHLPDGDKARQLQLELSQLRQSAGELFGEYSQPILAAFQEELDLLYQHNTELWVVEDKLREMERDKNFGDEFITLARTVYTANDARSASKRRLNLLSGAPQSEIKVFTARE